MSSLRRSTVSFKTITNVARWSCECWPEPGLVVMVAGAGLVFSPPSGPGVAELAGGGGHGRGGQAQEPAGGTAAQYGTLVREDSDKYARLVKELDVKVE